MPFAIVFEMAVYESRCSIAIYYEEHVHELCNMNGRSDVIPPPGQNGAVLEHAPVGPPKAGGVAAIISHGLLAKTCTCFTHGPTNKERLTPIYLCKE